MTELLELYDKEVSGKNASARNYKHIWNKCKIGRIKVDINGHFRTEEYSKKLNGGEA
jgi:hypothetical protein